jgi:hypothetical protein
VSGGPFIGRPGARQQERWQAIKRAYPLAELAWRTEPRGRSVRGRLGPDEPWTPWRLNLSALLAEVQQLADGTAEP